MAILTIRQNQRVETRTFEPPMALSALLNEAGFAVAQPCGGRGTCGKCAVMVDGVVSVPTAAEQRFKTRLACQVVLLGDAEVTLPNHLPMEQIQCGKQLDFQPKKPMEGRYGAAVDIGTTTIALQLYDLSSGSCIGAASMLNPQTSVAADVIGRIDAALHGKANALQKQVTNAITTLLAAACSQGSVAVSDVASMVITGNTTMLYLLTGKDPSALSRAPFLADCFFGTEIDALNAKCYLPCCLHAFVGADTTCALLSSGMTKRSETALLCDIGTNGEMALWHQGRLYIASTAAGPAFEGAGISCGCASVLGAIDRVTVVNGNLHCHTIGNQPAVGICGSGLLDAVASLLDTERMDETGYLEEEEVALSENVTLTQADIRAVQLAKAATYAGIMSLLTAANCDINAVEKLYIAGGFGSHLDLRSAVRIGLIPAELASHVEVIGNAALDGAAMLLMDTTNREQITAFERYTEHVRLDGNPDFADRYVEAMLFE